MTSTSSWHDAAGEPQPDLTGRKYPLHGSSALHNSRGSFWGKSGVARPLTRCGPGPVSPGTRSKWPAIVRNWPARARHPVHRVAVVFAGAMLPFGGPTVCNWAWSDTPRERGDPFPVPSVVESGAQLEWGRPAASCRQRRGIARKWEGVAD